MALSSLARAVIKNSDQLDQLITRGGVARVKRGLPKPSLSQLEFETQRAAEITRYGDEAAQIQESRALLSEASGDTAATARLRKNDPEVDQLMDAYKDRPDPAAAVDKNLRGKYKKRDEALSSQQASVAEYTEDDPKYFRTTRAKKERVERLAEMKAQGKVPSTENPLEEHHLIPKGITAAFMGRADELVAAGKASRQDVLAMAEYLKQETGTAGGDRMSDILFMRKNPHNEMHTYMEVGAGIEESKKEWQKKLAGVDDINELFEQWEQWIDDEGIYYKGTAEVWEPLDELLESVTGIPKDSRQSYKAPKK